MKIASKFLIRMSPYKNYSINSLTEKLKDNIWNNLSVLQKKFVIIELFSRKKKIHFLDSVSLEFINFNNPFINGMYDSGKETIYIRENVLKEKQGIIVYGILIHELQHALQHDEILRCYNSQAKISNKLKMFDIFLNHKNIYLDFCNHKEIGMFGFRDINLINMKLNMFYYLFPAEVEAYKVQESITGIDYLEEYYNLFRKFYNVLITNEEINYCIYSSIDFLINKKMPEFSDKFCDLLASIMYDLFHIAIYNKESYQINSDVKLANSLNIDRKILVLSKYGYNIPERGPLNDKSYLIYDCISNPQLIDKLTLAEQRVNSYIIKICYDIYGDKIRKYIKDSDLIPDNRNNDKGDIDPDEER